MSEQLIGHSPDLKRLRDEGYDIQVRSAHLLVRHVPYVTPQRQVKLGVLVAPLGDVAGDRTATPGDHTAYFAGETPSLADGTALRHIIESQHKTLADGVEVDFKFSSKPPSGTYPDYYEKMTTYVDLLASQARRIDASATAQTFPVIEATEEDSVFKYLDTASSRAGITAVSERLAIGKVAIVGLGGTGSYIIDLVAKTPVKEIHLYDGDRFISHNAFRSPGAPSVEQLRQEPSKAEFFRDAYSPLRRNVIAHKYYINDSNVEELRAMEFVFVAFEGSDKQGVVERLIEYGIPFVDVGMGIGVDNGALNGILRVTTGTPAHHAHISKRNRIPFVGPDGPDEYASNIQVADLNALNAALAVIKWKKLLGFYADLEQEHHSTYMTDGNALLNEDQT